MKIQIQVQATDRLNDSTHTFNVEVNAKVTRDAVGEARGVVIAYHTKDAIEQVGADLATLIARTWPDVQTITYRFHMA